MDRSKIVSLAATSAEGCALPWRDGISRTASTGGRGRGLPRSTVKAILTRQGDAFDQVKKAIAQRAAVLSETCLERAQEQAKKLTPYQALVGAKISTDHMLLALGREAPAPLVNMDFSGIAKLIQNMDEHQRELEALEAHIAELRAHLSAPQPTEVEGVAEASQPVTS